MIFKIGNSLHAGFIFKNRYLKGRRSKGHVFSFKNIKIFPLRNQIYLSESFSKIFTVIKRFPLFETFRAHCISYVILFICARFEFEIKKRKFELDLHQNLAIKFSPVILPPLII